jgi:VIT1/CCC1 family predicted Fe2+/Mn2+ transporter
MFFSYLIAGLIPLSPYVFKIFTQPVAWSIGLTLVSLFLLGVFNSRLSKRGFLKNGAITLFMGGVAITVGIIVGQIADKIK